MTFFLVPDDAPSPLALPEFDPESAEVFTGTACLALMDVDVVAEVWEDLLYDGHGHSHGAGGLALNSASVGTQVEHDGEFPVEVYRDADGSVVALRVNLDPYGDDLADVRDLDYLAAHAHTHSHTNGHTHHHPHDHGHAHGAHDHDHSHSHDDHSHAYDHDHDHDGHGDGHGHGGGHPEGWSPVEQIPLPSGQAVLGDPAGLPEADDTGGLLDLRFPATGGRVALTVFTESGLRRELRAVWSPA